MMRTKIHPTIIGFLLLLMFPTVIFGQNTDAACRAFVNRVFSDVGNNCAGLASNEVCYGYGEVTSTFNVAGESLISATDYGELVEVGDQTTILNSAENATLENLSGIQFVAPERANQDGEWGIALVNIQANLPQQLDSNGANYILFGDARIENAVLAEDAFILNDTVEVMVENVSIFNKPPNYNFDGYESEAIETVSGTFEADALSADGEWVRVFYNYERTFGQRTTAWLQTSELIDAPDLSNLPILGPNTFAPLQSFYLNSNPLLPECDNVIPNGILIQGPDEIETDIFVNETPIRITSTVFIDKSGPGTLRVSVLGGVIQINPGFDNEIIVAAGEQASICLDEMADLGIDNEADNRAFDPECGVEGPFVFGTTESSISTGLLQRLSNLSNLPNNLTNYRIPTIVITRPSGVGRPQISITFNDPNQARRLRNLCNQGAIPGRICDMLQ